MPGVWPLERRAEALFIQLDTLRATHHGDQQRLGFVAQIGLQITPQAMIEQP
ncbi:hypothetical protein D3C85_1734710 [compost metagenome]